jgi:hypothetical protein
MYGNKLYTQRENLQQLVDDSFAKAQNRDQPSFRDRVKFAFSKSKTAVLADDTE